MSRLGNERIDATSTVEPGMPVVAVPFSFWRQRNRASAHHQQCDATCAPAGGREE
jgi:hypothetical protein